MAASAEYSLLENRRRASNLAVKFRLRILLSQNFFANILENVRSALNAYFTNWSFVKNAIIAGTASRYPANGFFPATTSAVGSCSQTK